MSAAQPPKAGSTTEKKTADSKDGATATEAAATTTSLEEDDEFEDFPVEDWAQEETSLPAGPTQTTHLWEESWDDDDGTSDEFAKQLREELKKMGSKGS